MRPAPRDDDDNSDDGIGDLAIHLKTLETFFRLYIPTMDDRLRALLNKSLVELYARFGITWNTDIRAFPNNRFPTIGDLYKLISEKCVNDRNNSVYYEDLKTYLESAANGADHGLWNGYTTINPQSSFVVLDLPSFKLLFGVDGDSLRETQNVFGLNEAQYELLAAKQRGIALMKVGSQAVKVKFEFSDKRLAMFGKGGGR